jgi:hypothetical protein
MTLHGHVQNGEIVFNPPVALPEGASVKVEVETRQTTAEASGATTGEIPSLLERMHEFVGKFDGLPPDASVNLDHYLYGTPKRQ